MSITDIFGHTASNDLPTFDATLLFFQKHKEDPKLHKATLISRDKDQPLSKEERQKAYETLHNELTLRYGDALQSTDNVHFARANKVRRTWIKNKSVFVRLSFDSDAKFTSSIIIEYVPVSFGSLL